MNLLRAMLASIALILTGCVETRFESLPGSDVARCDARWVGNWRMVSAKDKDKDEGDNGVFIAISEGCERVRVFERGKEDDKIRVALHFARVGKHSVLAAQIDEESPSDSKPASEWDTGYYYFLYDANPRRIALRAVDDEHVATRLIDGSLRGRTEMVSQRPGSRKPSQGRSLYNFVAGDAQTMVQAVQLRGMFLRSSDLSLIRVESIPGLQRETGTQ